LIKTKEGVRDALIASAFMTLGVVFPGAPLTQGFQEHLGGIALGIGFGWLLKSIIVNHQKEQKIES